MTFPEIAVFHHLMNTAIRDSKRGRIGFCPDVGVRTIAERMQKSRNAIRNAVRGLERRRYIEVHPDGILVLNFNGDNPEPHGLYDDPGPQTEGVIRGTSDGSLKVPPTGHERYQEGVIKGTGTNKRDGDVKEGDVETERTIAFVRRATARESGFEGPGVEKLKESLRAEYQEEFGDDWLWATWLGVIRHAFKHPKWIQAKKDLPRTVENWFDKEATEDRKRGK